jgi:vancomycin resistance protein YoaR
MGRFPGKILLILIVLFQAAAGIAGGIGAAGYYYENRIIPGLEVGRLPLGGLTYEEARGVLFRELVSPSSITLAWKEKTFSISLCHGIDIFQVDEVLENAWEMGKLSRSNHYYFNTVRWVPLSASLKIPLFIPASYLLNELQKIKNEIDREPEDARVAIEEGAPFVVDEQPGWFLDLYQSKKCVEEHLQMGHFVDIPLIVKEKLPHITRADLPDSSCLIASYSTSLDDSGDDRRHNIMLAKEAINGRIIEPGEVFSFNNEVGPVTVERGYREALVIQNRQFVSGIGGGVCQAATTLYGVALRGEMEIVQRSSHSRPVSYVPLGQDATVAQGLIDFQFCNNRHYPVLLTGKMDDCLTFFLYGAEQETEKSVEIVTEDIEVLAPRLLEQPDPSLPKGVRRLVQEGEEGYLVNVYCLIKEGDQKTKKELISTDVYMPINEVLKIGTREVAKEKK